MNARREDFRERERLFDRTKMEMNLLLLPPPPFCLWGRK